LVHRAYRAKSDADRLRRLAFVEELCRDVPIHPVRLEIACSIGRIEGRQAAKGISLAFEDLAIRVTALELSYEVATLNVRHFRVLPGLKTVPL
jgi:predicted nucleic acid-binding protein